MTLWRSLARARFALRSSCPPAAVLGQLWAQQQQAVTGCLVPQSSGLRRPAHRCPALSWHGALVGTDRGRGAQCSGRHQLAPAFLSTSECICPSRRSTRSSAWRMFVLFARVALFREDPYARCPNFQAPPRPGASRRSVPWEEEAARAGTRQARARGGAARRSAVHERTAATANGGGRGTGSRVGHCRAHPAARARLAPRRRGVHWLCQSRVRRDAPPARQGLDARLRAAERLQFLPLVACLRRLVRRGRHPRRPRSVSRSGRQLSVCVCCNRGMGEIVFWSWSQLYYSSS